MIRTENLNLSLYRFPIDFYVRSKESRRLHFLTPKGAVIIAISYVL